jgi:hypothetical protein
MLPDNLDMNSLSDARRKAVEKSIRSLNAEDLKSLIDEIFPYYDDPWRQRFTDFIQENSGSAFYHATTQDPVHILYCSTKEKGIWFLPGSGVGMLQERALKMLKEVAAKH